MKCDILRSFAYATDDRGIGSTSVAIGSTGVEIPDHLVPDLERGGYLKLAAGAASGRKGGKGGKGSAAAEDAQAEASPEKTEDPQ